MIGSKHEIFGNAEPMYFVKTVVSITKDGSMAKCTDVKSFMNTL